MSSTASLMNSIVKSRSCACDSRRRNIADQRAELALTVAQARLRRLVAPQLYKVLMEDIEAELAAE
jgi:hypothetical protein